MKKELPAKEITISLFENSYVCKSPKVSQIIDVESNKMLFSNQTYGAMVRSLLKTANQAMDLIEMVACFSVFIPGLKKDLRVDSLFDLDIASSKLLIKAYKDKFLPWYSDWLALLNDDEDDNTEVKKD